MRISLKAIYGIMAAMDLALADGRGPVQSKSIARRHAIPVRFLEQVLLAMKQAGLIESLRGAQGGYVLSKAAPDMTLAEIVQALDGPLALPRQPRAATRRPQERVKFESVLLPIWERVRDAEITVLSAITLKDLLERYRALEQNQAIMFHI